MNKLVLEPLTNTVADGGDEVAAGDYLVGNVAEKTEGICRVGRDTQGVGEEADVR